MPTTEQEKPTAKQRQRSRKAEQRKEKGERKTQVLAGQVLPDQVLADQVLPDQILADQVLTHQLLAEQAMSDAGPIGSSVASIETAPVETTPAGVVQTVVAKEQAAETVLSGELLPPETRELAPLAAGPFAVALAYGEYTRKSWLAGRFLVERLIAVRSFGEAIEVQGEFARFACANFLAQSQKISEFYAAWAQQFFRPFEKFAR